MWEWVRQADLDAGVGSDGLTGVEREELAALRRENLRLREDVEILKRATAFFALQGDSPMMLSSRLGMINCVGLPGSQYGVQHVDAAAGQRDDLVVPLAFGSFAVVEGAAGRVALQGAERRLVEDPFEGAVATEVCMSSISVTAPIRSCWHR